MSYLTSLCSSFLICKNGLLGGVNEHWAQDLERGKFRIIVSYYYLHW